MEAPAGLASPQKRCAVREGVRVEHTCAHRCKQHDVARVIAQKKQGNTTATAYISDVTASSGVTNKRISFEAVLNCIGKHNSRQHSSESRNWSEQRNCCRDTSTSSTYDTCQNHSIHCRVDATRQSHHHGLACSHSRRETPVHDDHTPHHGAQMIQSPPITTTTTTTTQHTYRLRT